MPLRRRLIAALILTSVLTLAVVAMALLVPLDKRLHSDAVKSLTATTLAARPTFARIPTHEVSPDSPALRDAVEDVRRRTGDEVAAIGSGGQVLAATEPDAGSEGCVQRGGDRPCRPEPVVDASRSAVEPCDRDR
jgi:hypothetical protein